MSLLLLSLSLAASLGSTPHSREESLRYDQSSLPRRFAADLVDIPAGIPQWEGRDWAYLLAVAAPTVSLMLPLHHPLDARIQRWIRAELGDRRLVWSPLGELVVWGSIVAALGASVGYGLWLDIPHFLEMTSLAVEAFLVAQVSQFVFKLMLGREGPNDGQALGAIHGPPGFFRLFPAGTPSGHVATLYAMLGAVDAYWERPWLSTLLHLFGVAFSALVVIDNYHFVSDVIWGAGMGYAIGAWVVRHRRGSVPAPDNPWMLLPTAGGAPGVALATRF